jgi:sugar phosphate isomerase/epimerase
MDTSRRSFIKNGAIVFAGMAILPYEQAFAATQKEKKIAIQLFSFDKELNDNAGAALKLMKESGYNYVEHSGYSERRFYGYKPNDFKKLLSDSGLTLLSGHSVLELKHWNNTKKQFTTEWLATIEDAATAGQQYLISPWLDQSLWNNENELLHFLEVMNNCGKACKSAGVQFGYHNHQFEFEHTINNKRLYETILQNTDASLVAQQLDVGNTCLSAKVIYDLFKKYPTRFDLIHIKDIAPAENYRQKYKSVPLGEGILDLKNIVRKAAQSGTTCYVIDQGNVDFSSVAYSRQNLSALQSLVPGWS